jgi:pilus assembly protein CpaE
MARGHGQRGQATVEAVATLPFVVLVVLVCWQLAVAGQALWLSGAAARAAARAQALGHDPGDGCGPPATAPSAWRSRCRR